MLDDLGRSLVPECADSCLTNLPFEPTPRDVRNFLYADGKYGDDLISRFLPIAESLLARNGRALIPAFSLLREGSSRLELILRKARFKKLSVAVVRLSEPIDIGALS